MLMPKCSLLIERPARAAASSITTRPADASSGVHSEGSHPSDNRPQRSRAAGAVPPNHTSSGCCTGRGESLTSRKLPAVPSWLTVSPAHSRRKSGSASSMKAPRRLGSTPMASRSGAYVSPGTSVTSSRPLDSTSRLASCLASRSTWRPGNSIVVPSFNRGLFAAAQERPTTGSSTGAVSTSESHRESNPRSSRPRTSSASASGVDKVLPAPTPMRIFIAGHAPSATSSRLLPRYGNRGRGSTFYQRPLARQTRSEAPCSGAWRPGAPRVRRARSHGHRDRRHDVGREPRRRGDGRAGARRGRSPGELIRPSRERRALRTLQLHVLQRLRVRETADQVDARFLHAWADAPHERELVDRDVGHPVVEDLAEPRALANDELVREAVPRLRERLREHSERRVCQA